MVVWAEDDKIGRLIRPALTPGYDMVDLGLVDGFIAPFALLLRSVEVEFILHFLRCWRRLVRFSAATVAIGLSFLDSGEVPYSRDRSISRNKGSPNDREPTKEKADAGEKHN